MSGRPDVLDVARKLRLKVKEERLRGCDGVLLRPQGVARGIIAVRGDIRSPGRKRFTIAHEIGHFVLHGYDDHSSICKEEDIEGWAKHGDGKERQADDFAAELLIPATAVALHLVSNSPSLSVIESIANDCGASLSASAWRYCDLTSEQCAVVWSENEEVAWSKASSEFPFFIKKGKRIEQASYAYTCFKGEPVPTRPELVPAEAWIDSWNLIEGSQIYEESRALPAYGSVLTLIWIKDRVERKSDYDEDEGEPLDPSEFTVYRKRWPR
jgi:Zn-dependent peptidase ImmA (M78 family)